MQNKWQVIIVMCSLLLIIQLSGCFTENNTEKKGISAKEAWGIIEEEVYEWDPDAILIIVIGVSDGLKDGKATEWEYTYSNSDVTEIMEITINSDNAISTRYGEYNTSKFGNIQIIYNWTIDSTEAVRIAKTDLSIKDFLSEYPNAEITTLKLTGRNEYSDNCTWIINWHGGYSLDHEGMAIAVDGSTGEINPGE